mmetsp:Transcript_7572/g.10864  ORF Transcript_7572/g.10864 Transcript_7572/m.10864 type:complete len:405 (-) Transcript_7572:40-1254(-)
MEEDPVADDNNYVGNTHDENERDSKRLRVEEGDYDETNPSVLTSNSIQLYEPPRNLSFDGEEQQEQEEDIIRTSSLSSPTMKLTGHKGSVYALSYSPDGECLVSGSFDMTCLLWNATYDCVNFNVLKGHKNAILDVKWNKDSDFVVTASADHTLGWYDATTGERMKRCQGHEGIVNSVDCAPSHSRLLISGSDDRTARLWDVRTRGDVGILEHDFQCTAVAYGLDGNTVYTSGIDHLISAWDVRSGNKPGQDIKRKRSFGAHISSSSSSNLIMKMKGHEDIITCLSVHPKGTHLLSNSMDGTLKTWDIRPFVPDGKRRHSKTFHGASHNAEKGLLNCSWNKDGTMVSGGSADKIVHIWDELTTEELYYLPGHSGCVNSVIFHPKENVIASASSDKSIFVGELAC